MDRVITQLRVKGMIKDPRIEKVILKVDRRHYCPGDDPYRDMPHSIGWGATISAPHMHAFALEHLKGNLKEGARALDVGSGSGYMTVCMAHMVGASGKVYGVDHIKELVNFSLKNIRNDCPEFLDSKRIEMIRADGRLGLPDKAPFDVIHVGASTEGFPDKLVEQLKEGGVMVAPIQQGCDSFQDFEKVEKLVGGGIKRETLITVRYIPLTDVETQMKADGC